MENRILKERLLTIINLFFKKDNDDSYKYSNKEINDLIINGINKTITLYLNVFNITNEQEIQRKSFLLLHKNKPKYEDMIEIKIAIEKYNKLSILDHLKNNLIHDNDNICNRDLLQIMGCILELQCEINDSINRGVKHVR